MGRNNRILTSHSSFREQGDTGKSICVLTHFGNDPSDNLREEILCWTSLKSLEELWLFSTTEFRSPESSHLLPQNLVSTCASCGLLAPTFDRIRIYAETKVDAIFARFMPFPFRICYSVIGGDIEYGHDLMSNLLALEKECWEPHMRLSEEKIRIRLSLRNSPPFFVKPLSDDRVVGVLYVQRVKSFDNLEGVTFQNLERVLFLSKIFQQHKKAKIYQSQKSYTL